MSDDWLYAWGVGYAAVGAASLLVPLYAISLGADAFHVGLMASTAAFAGVPGALLWGRLAARTGRRRPFVLVALGSTAGVLALTPVLTSPWTLLLANAALWFVVSAAAPVLNLIVVEGVPESAWDERIGSLNAVQGYGWVVGLAVGTVWTALAPRVLDPTAAQELLFFLLAVTTTIALGVVRLRYPERPTTDPARFRRAFRRFEPSNWGAGRFVRAVPYGPNRLYWVISISARRWRARRRRSGGDQQSGTVATEGGGSPLRRYFVAVGLFSVGSAIFWGPMPAYLTDVGFVTGVVFLLFLSANVGSAVCYTPVGKLVGKRGPRPVQSVALAVRSALFPAVGLAGVVLGTSLGYALALAFLLIGVTWAAIAVTATGIVTRISPSGNRGEALGAYTAIAGFGGGVGSVVGGAIASLTGYTVTFVLAGVVVAAGLGLVVRE